MPIKQLCLILLLGLAAMPARADLQVFACEPEWADLVTALVPDARVAIATTAWQDPHYIEARPSLIAAMSRADLAVCTGASLEAGWLPALINKASNQRIRKGEPGMFYAAEQVPLHRPHDHVDRSMGDVHPEGDPHIHLDPKRVPAVMEALAVRLKQIAPGLENDIRRRHLQWRVQWNLKKARWQEAAEKLAGTGVVVQHANFDYLLRWLGVKAVLDLEPKPGLPPSASHLSKLLAEPELAKVSAILIALYQDDRPANWLSGRTGLPVLTLPGTVTDEHKTLSEVISHIVTSLLVAQSQKAGPSG
jgi:zinc/manganese transport system substrate-binding protein